MSTCKSCITPPLFKDLGKDASDLLNKDFQDKGFEVSLKTAGGDHTFNPSLSRAHGETAFAGLWKSTCTGSKLGKWESELATSGAFKVTLSNEKLLQDSKLSGTFESDKDSNKTVKVGAEVKKSAVALATTVTVPLNGKQQTVNVNAVVKKADVCAGADVEVDSSGSVTSKNVTLAHCSDGQAVFASYKSKAGKDNCSVVYYNKKVLAVNAAVAGELSVGVGGGSGKRDVKLTVASTWDVDGGKIKVKADSAGAVRAAYTTKVNPSTKLTVGSDFDLTTFTASKFGVGVAFE